MANCKKHMLSKVVKNIIFQNKTLLVGLMFYRHNKTFWYQFCKHFLKAENSADSLASSCEEYCISFLVTQYETGLLTGLLLEPGFSLRVKVRIFTHSDTKVLLQMLCLPC